MDSPFRFYDPVKGWSVVYCGSLDFHKFLKSNYGDSSDTYYIIYQIAGKKVWAQIKLDYINRSHDVYVFPKSLFGNIIILCHFYFFLKKATLLSK